MNETLNRVKIKKKTTIYIVRDNVPFPSSQGDDSETDRGNGSSKPIGVVEILASLSLSDGGSLGPNQEHLINGLNDREQQNCSERCKSTRVPDFEEGSC